MLEVSLRALEEATVQQDGTAWQASVLDGARQADGIETYHVTMYVVFTLTWTKSNPSLWGSPSHWCPVAQSNQNLKFLIALICVQSNSALALLQNQAAFAEYQDDFSAPELPGGNLQDEPPADSFGQWVQSGCVLSAPGHDWEDLLAEQAQREVAASAYAHGSATLADDTNVEEKQVFLTILPTF